MSDRYAVIGHPISHSKSPLIHSRFAAQTRQDMIYEALLAPLDDFAGSVRTFIAAGGRGANVTVPFKEQAWQLATRLTPRAQAAGAVNTLSFENGEILGDNTDGTGLTRDIRDHLATHIAGQRVLLLGAGGAARGCLLPLLDERPARLTLANRTPARAAALVDEFARHTPAGIVFEHRAIDALNGPYDLIINATAAGLSDQALALPDSLFTPQTLAYDMLYGRDTAFLQQARRCGARTADGLGMLIEQAAEAFYIWRGLRPDTASLRTELRQP